MLGPDDCWEWQGGKDFFGYGRAWLNGRRVKAHRFSMFIRMCKVLPKSILVCHHCDNPPCCNPGHLFLGDYQHNMTDKMKKGRHRSLKGENHRGAKLSDEIVREIFQRYEGGGETNKSLAKRFNVDPMTINCVLRRVTWSHVEV